MGRFPDDEWREILEANGFLPSGAREEVWRNGNVAVKIDVNRETQEPYYQVGATRGTDSEELKNLITKEPEPSAPEEVKRKDDEFLKSMGIIGSQPQQELQPEHSGTKGRLNLQPRFEPSPEEEISPNVGRPIASVRTEKK